MDRALLELSGKRAKLVCCRAGKAPGAGSVRIEVIGRPQATLVDEENEPPRGPRQHA